MKIFYGRELEVLKSQEFTFISKLDISTFVVSHKLLKLFSFISTALKCDNNHYWLERSWHCSDIRIVL